MDQRRELDGRAGEAFDAVQAARVQEDACGGGRAEARDLDAQLLTARARGIDGERFERRSRGPCRRKEATAGSGVVR